VVRPMSTTARRKSPGWLLHGLVGEGSGSAPRRRGRQGRRLASQAVAWRGEVNRSRRVWASSGRAKSSVISVCRAAWVFVAQCTSGSRPVGSCERARGPEGTAPGGDLCRAGAACRHRPSSAAAGSPPGVTPDARCAARDSNPDRCLKRAGRPLVGEEEPAQAWRPSSPARAMGEARPW
jgi:hypothetical protein